MAAAIHSHAVASPIYRCPPQRRFLAGLISLPMFACQSMHSSFNGQSLPFRNARRAQLGGTPQMSRPITMMVRPAIQFIQGTDEQTIPDVRLTKSRDGSNGVATFVFEEPSVFDSSGELGDITGFYMIDEEGTLQSVDVNAKFINGKPARIEAKYIMRSPREWDRFMRFMERYSNENGLQFVKK
ncbi:photosystem II reaction center PSB28 protein, chloroplastic [Magnolia sinica]|uniref:photosystem II reaction center PSB28 protein, chloroplastic n=1 Tax=Magnolia sinica TaxID=86752 RepID=UPI00265A1F41|nr:photosystem II reaction center PSB28 protein, chloroplastic [Magnolia sinica]